MARLHLINLSYNQFIIVSLLHIPNLSHYNSSFIYSRAFQDQEWNIENVHYQTQLDICLMLQEVFRCTKKKNKKYFVYHTRALLKTSIMKYLVV